MKRIYSTIIILIFFSLIAIANKGEKEQDNEKPILVYSVVEQTSDETGGNEIWVIKDGKIQNTGIEAYEIYWMLDQRDYDGDGLEEAYVAQSTGGSGYSTRTPKLFIRLNLRTWVYSLKTLLSCGMGYGRLQVEPHHTMNAMSLKVGE